MLPAGLPCRRRDNNAHSFPKRTTTRSKIKSERATADRKLFVRLERFLASACTSYSQNKQITKTMQLDLSQNTSTPRRPDPNAKVK